MFGKHPMARPRSEDKQIALLEAATDVVAEQGLGAPTSLIAKRAGVAEGTLFRYFATKDELLNELYLDIKRSLGESMRELINRAATPDELVRSLWDGYIDWGIANPVAVKALNQLAVSDKITAQTRAKVVELFPEMHQISSACTARGSLSSLPRAFSDALLVALADATMLFAARDPERAEEYKAAGFRIFREGIIQ